MRAFLTEAGLQAGAHDQRTAAYSKGMRQKVGIAIALAKEAKALLLDEPTSGLDPAASHEFSALLKKLSARGVAILMATHDLFRAQEDATRVGVMRAGRLVHKLSAPPSAPPTSKNFTSKPSPPDSFGSPILPLTATKRRHALGHCQRFLLRKFASRRAHSQFSTFSSFSPSAFDVHRISARSRLKHTVVLTPDNRHCPLAIPRRPLNFTA